LYYKEIEDNMDELFATLLNQNSEIIIGAEKFSFDFATETVSVSVIMNDNVSKGSKTVYNFEDDYFSIQDDNNSENSKTDYCKSLDLTWDFYTNFLGAPTMRCRVRYFNFAIYHTLSAQFEHTTGYTFDPYHEFGLYTEGHCFVTNRNQYNNRDISLSSPIISYNLNNGITYRPYQNSRRLTDYRLYVNFYLNDDPHFQGINNYCNI
jgi:hypothetical protein